MRKHVKVKQDAACYRLNHIASCRHDYQGPCQQQLDSRFAAQDAKMQIAVDSCSPTSEPLLKQHFKVCKQTVTSALECHPVLSI